MATMQYSNTEKTHHEQLYTDKIKSYRKDKDSGISLTLARTAVQRFLGVEADRVIAALLKKKKIIIWTEIVPGQGNNPSFVKLR